MLNFIYRTATMLALCLCVLTGVALAQQSPSQAAPASEGTAPQKASKKIPDTIKRGGADNQQASEPVVAHDASEMVPDEDEQSSTAAGQASEPKAPQKASKSKKGLIELKQVSKDTQQAKEEVTAQTDAASEPLPAEDGQENAAPARASDKVPVELGREKKDPLQ